MQKFTLLKAMNVKKRISQWRSEGLHHSSSNLSDITELYAESSLLGLPLELLRKIIQNIEVEDWLNLCLTCKYFNQIVNKFFLYQDVKIRTKEKLVKFRKSISKNKKTNLLSLYVSRIEFIKPIKELQQNTETSIGGFSYSDPQYTDKSESYIGLVLEVISLLPNLSDISFRHIAPGFQFPEWTSSLKTNAHEHNYYPSIRRLRLSSEPGWSISLRPNLLWPFGLIDELILYDMVIDSNSLAKPPLLTVTNGNGPLRNRYALTSESNQTWSPVRALSISSCSIASNGSRYLEQYFKDVEVLKLISLKSHYDILLCHCFPSLKELYIDLNSKCFSLYDQQVEGSINVGNNNSNYAYFNSKFVPKFYLNYPKFTDVLEKKLPTNIEKICLVNVSFTNITPVDPEDRDNLESDKVNNNLFHFLKSLVDFKCIDFIMLKNYKLHQSRTLKDWETLLWPCFSSTNSIRVKDKDGSVLFSRNEKY
jgi:hypothetical protein